MTQVIRLCSLSAENGTLHFFLWICEIMNLWNCEFEKLWFCELIWDYSWKYFDKYHSYPYPYPYPYPYHYPLNFSMDLFVRVLCVRESPQSCWCQIIDWRKQQQLLQQQPARRNFKSGFSWWEKRASKTSSMQLLSSLPSPRQALGILEIIFLSENMQVVAMQNVWN